MANEKFQEGRNVGFQEGRGQGITNATQFQQEVNDQLTLEARNKGLDAMIFGYATLLVAKTQDQEKIKQINETAADMVMRLAKLTKDEFTKEVIREEYVLLDSILDSKNPVANSKTNAAAKNSKWERAKIELGFIYQAWDMSSLHQNWINSQSLKPFFVASVFGLLFDWGFLNFRGGIPFSYGALGLVSTYKAIFSFTRNQTQYALVDAFIACLCAIKLVRTIH